jgi:hypothetical protein
MSGGIYLLQGDALVEMTEAAYDSEALLQGLLADHPSLLAGGQVNPTAPRRTLPTSMPADDSPQEQASRCGPSIGASGPSGGSGRRNWQPTGSSCHRR